MSIEGDASNRRASEERNVYSNAEALHTQSLAGRHVSEILAARIIHEKADNALEDVLTQLELNGERM